MNDLQNNKNDMSDSSTNSHVAYEEVVGEVQKYFKARLLNYVFKFLALILMTFVTSKLLTNDAIKLFHLSVLSEHVHTIRDVTMVLFSLSALGALVSTIRSILEQATIEHAIEQGNKQAVFEYYRTIQHTKKPSMSPTNKEQS